MNYTTKDNNELYFYMVYLKRNGYDNSKIDKKKVIEMYDAIISNYYAKRKMTYDEKRDLYVTYVTNEKKISTKTVR